MLLIFSTLVIHTQALQQAEMTVIRWMCGVRVYIDIDIDINA